MTSWTFPINDLGGTSSALLKYKTPSIVVWFGVRDRSAGVVYVPPLRARDDVVLDTVPVKRNRLEVLIALDALIDPHAVAVLEYPMDPVTLF
jgi:hypothetical protein